MPKNSPAAASTSTVSRWLAGPRAWVLAQREFWLDYLILFVVFIVVWVGTILLRQQYFPDSGHYLGMALWFSGMPQQEALQVALERHIANGYQPNTTIAELFDWGLVKPRVVLPLLSVPFIWIFGPNGLAVTTGLITFILTFATYKFLARHYGRTASVVVSLLVLSSMFIMLFNLGMLTESLSALWGLLTVAMAYRFQRDRRWRWIIGMAVITVLSGFTRQATLIVAGAFFVAWLLSLRSRERRRDWALPALAVVGTSLIVQVLQTLLFPFSQADQYMRMTGTDTIWGAIAATPALIVSLLRHELGNYFAFDQVLVVFLVLCAISMVLFWRRTETHLLLGALAGIALYSITNGNPTNFRYALPGLIFFMANAALLVNQIALKVSQNRPGTPAAPETPIAASPRS
jgi:hypothetical protein